MSAWIWRYRVRGVPGVFSGAPPAIRAMQDASSRAIAVRSAGIELTAEWEPSSFVVQDWIGPLAPNTEYVWPADPTGPNWLTALALTRAILRARATGRTLEAVPYYGHHAHNGDTYPAPADGWVCFHCGERFRTPGSAAVHFGARPTATPACRMDSTARGLLKRLRAVEIELAQSRERKNRLIVELHALRGGFDPAESLADFDRRVAARRMETPNAEP